MASDEGEPSRKRSLDEIPPSMQFYKWAGLDRMTEETERYFQTLCFGENKEANDIIYKLLRYARSQKRQEKEYKDNMKQKQSETAQKHEPVASPSSNQRNAGSLLKTKKEYDDEVQFLLERKREIEREIADAAIDESETEVIEEPTESVEVVKEKCTPVVEVSAPQAKPAVQQTTPVPQQPVLQSALSSRVIKQEPSEDSVAPTIQLQKQAPAAESTVLRTSPISIPSETVAATSSTTAAAPLPRVMPQKQIKSEGAPPVAQSPIARPLPVESPLSTIAVADEPLTTATRKVQLKRVRFSLESPAKATIAQEQPAAVTAPVARKTVQPPVAAAATQTSKAVQQPPAVAKQQIVQHQPQTAPVAKAVVQQPAVVAAVAPQQSIQRQKTQLVKKEQAAPQQAEDPVEVAILSRNLVGLNQQIDYLNKIKDLARAKKLPSEFFYTEFDQLADPSPRFNYSYFKNQIGYVLRIAKQTDDELSQFDQHSDGPLRITLKSVNTELAGIFKRVKDAIGAHRSAKKMAVQQKEGEHLQQSQQQPPVHKIQPQQRTQGPTTSAKSAWVPLKQNQQPQPLKKSAVKRHQQEVATPQHNRQPVSKRPRVALLETPAPPIHDDYESDDEQITLKDHNSLPSTSKKPAVVWRGYCPFCNSIHNPIKCNLYKTHQQREERRRELKLCFYCLRPYSRGHESQCLSYGKPCSHCKGHKSHTALCRWLHKPPRKERPPRKFFAERAVRFVEREEEFEDDGAQFSPSPYYEEEVSTTEAD